MASGKRRAPATPKQKATARTMFERGDSLGEIAKEAGVARSTVSSWSKRNGWSRPDGFAQTDAAQKTVAARNRAQQTALERLEHRAQVAADIADLFGDIILASLEKAADGEGDTTLAQKSSTSYGTYVDKARVLAVDLKATTSGRDPRMTDPEELARGLEDLIARARPT